MLKRLILGFLLLASAAYAQTTKIPLVTGPQDISSTNAALNNLINQINNGGLGGGGSGTPGGTSGQCQYNSAGAFGGVSGCTSDGTTITLVAPILGAATGTSLALGGATIGTSALAAIGNIDVQQGTVTLNGGSTAAEQVGLFNRTGIGIPVPYWQPTAVTSALALDMVPSGGTPSDFSATTGVAWQDICNSSAAVTSPNYTCLRLGIFASGNVQVSSAFGGTGAVHLLSLNLNGGTVAFGKSGTSSVLGGATSGSAQMVNVACSGTVPDILPAGTSSTSGWGCAAANTLTAIISGVGVGSFTSTGLNSAALGATTPSTVNATTYATSGVAGVDCAANSVTLLTEVVSKGIVTHC